MSVKIAWLRITGKLGKAEKIESERYQLEKTYRAFLEAEGSEELKVYLDMEAWVNSGAPQIRKNELESLVFQGSLEYNQLKEFGSLQKSKPIRNYFKIAESPDLKRFERSQESPKMKDFWDLKEYVEGGSFQNDKRDIEAIRFEGSVEQHRLRELDQIQHNRAFRAYQKIFGSGRLEEHARFLKSDKLNRFLELQNAPSRDKIARREFFKLKMDQSIRSYFRFENSRDLKYYREIAHSHLLSRYRELLTETGTEKFKQRVAQLKDKKKLKKSEAWNKYMHFKRLSSDPDVAFHLKFENSTLYRNYLDVSESFQLERYHELKEKVTSPAFVERKSYLEDKRKWEKSDEYAKMQQFLQLKKHPKILLYQRYHQSKAFDFFRQWEMTFCDNFDGKELDRSKWTPNMLWADRLLGDSFSQPGDLQAYSGGKNTSAEKGKLVISVKKETLRSRQWIPGAGLVPRDFTYTSDTLSTMHGFWQQEGIFEAKIKFHPVKEVVSTLCLMGESQESQIALCETGPFNRMGLLLRKGQAQPEFSGVTLSPLRKNVFYLFRLEWKGQKLVWKLNDQTLFELETGSLNYPVHLNLTSLVVDEIPVSRLPVRFEVEWIRCYRKK